MINWASLGVEEAPNKEGEDAPKKLEAEDAGWPKGLLKEVLEAAALLPPKLKAELLPPNNPPPPPVEEPKLKPPPDCSESLMRGEAQTLVETSIVLH